VGGFCGDFLAIRFWARSTRDQVIDGDVRDVDGLQKIGFALLGKAMLEIATRIPPWDWHVVVYFEAVGLPKLQDFFNKLPAAVSVHGIGLQDREFFAAICEGRGPNSSVAKVLPCQRVLHQLGQSNLMLLGNQLSVNGPPLASARWYAGRAWMRAR